MRIRVKLTIVLLAATLTPLLVLRAVDSAATRRLSERVETQATDAVARRVEQELTLHATGIAERMGERVRTVTLIVRSQAELFSKAVELPLAPEPGGVPASPAAFPGTPPVLTTAQFDGEESVSIPGLREQPGWRAGAAFVPLVTYDAPVFVPAPGLSLEEPAVAARARRLAGATELIDAFSAGDRTLVRSQYVCLADGLHMAFPGKGGYPSGFDGRERPWYTGALVAEGPVWIGPIIDAVTGEPRMTCSAVVPGPDGQPVGVTAVDISLQEALNALALPPDLALGSETLVVAINDEGLGVIMSARGGGAGAATLANPAPLRASDDTELAQMRRDLAAGRGGVAFMPRDGQDSVWAYARMGPGVGVVIIVPRARIAGMVEGVRQDLRTLSQETFRSTAAALVVVVLVSFALAYLLGRTLSRPIRRLADAAEAVASGDLTARAAVRARGDEIGKLARTFNQMVPALADRIRLRESIALANDLQQGLLPAANPSIPGFDVFGVAMYCDETGGDYYDYLQPLTLGDGRYGVVVGDVTGHGIPAALIMTSARALLQSHARTAGSPGAVLDRVNETIAQDASQGRFITLVLLTIDTSNRRMTAANAGHEPGLVYRAASGVFDELPLGGLPLGIQPDERYDTEDIAYPAPGDVFLFATDGVWEMRGPGGEFFGKERMREAIRANAGGSAEEIGRGLIDALEAFRGSTPKSDDVTFIVLKAT